MDKLGLLLFGCVVLSMLAISWSVAEEPVMVETKLGSYRGYVRKSVTNKSVKVFQGIPFAQPPIGPNRFKPPLPVQPHNGTIDCKEFGPACMQKLSQIHQFNPFIRYIFGLGAKGCNEDCLFLNVYIPKNGSENFPVMVWIYGGGFATGTANSEVYDGTTLAAEENVIVVTFNYRVSFFGFLYLGLDGAPGNMGLMDQAMALRWVRDHISSFGGDPKRVTLFGQSAGAASVGHHILLNSSRPLFHRAILESGVPHMGGAFETRQYLLDAAALLADNVGCPFNRTNLEPTLNCFMSKDSQELMDNEPIHGYTYNLFFKPVVDGQYITEHPELTIRKGLDFVNMPIIIGNTKDESTIFFTMFYQFIFPLNDNVKPDEEDCRFVMRETIGLANDSLILELTWNLYKDEREKDLHKRLTKTAVQFGSDAAFICPSVQFEDAMVKAKNKVFKYRFSHRDSHFPFPKWMGVIHGGDLSYVFGEMMDPNKNYDADSKVLSRRMMRYWANFARTGDPNVSPSDAGPLNETVDLSFWEPIKEPERNYLIFEKKNIFNGFHNNKKCAIWEDIFPRIYELENQKKLPGVPRVINLDAKRFYT